MRETHLRKHDNIIKRLLVHVGAFNLSLLLRQAMGIGKPRRLQDGQVAGILELVWRMVMCELTDLVVFVMELLRSSNLWLNRNVNTSIRWCARTT
jgi:hypothetical protein